MSKNLRVLAGIVLAASLAVPARVLTQSCPLPTITGQSFRPNTLVLTRASYDYQPTVMKDGKYRMWWCGGVAGDYVLYAESDFLNGPWSTPQAVLSPTGNANDFDGIHVCDPSVIRVNGTYYMYYGGAGTTTKVGVATSQNGLSWTRLNGGQPIIVPAQNVGGYGAGQPTITHVDGWFYLAFTDTTGMAGAGIYVMRSTDPTFQSGVQELIGPGSFAARTPQNHTSYLFLQTFGVDWQYVDMTNQFAIAISQGDALGNPITQVRLFDANLTAQQGSIDIPGDWDEGPGLVSRPDKHAVPSTQCGIVPLDVFKALGAGNEFTWDLVHAGIDWNTNLGCSCSNLGKVFNGEGIRAPNRPWSVVVGGNVVGFQLAAPIFRLTKNMWDLSTPTFDSVPSNGAALVAGNYTVYTDNAPGSFILNDGRRWPVSCLEIVTDNQSSLTWIPSATYHSYPVGPDLKCVQ